MAPKLGAVPDPPTAGLCRRGHPDCVGTAGARGASEHAKAAAFLSHITDRPAGCGTYHGAPVPIPYPMQTGGFPLPALTPGTGAPAGDANTRTWLCPGNFPMRKHF